ncbi:hypothetical protein TCE0_004r00221 [Talaromyces pinophilus]|uniref:BOD1/SHG1 domain-containing protein n=1 Tax=Talaromyces pinophilus TaxID=128442 RepID=A0A0B8N3D2_TALPI|nr:hypothetical protein TCE0_004r00221 [Talaromyces pinophilus]
MADTEMVNGETAPSNDKQRPEEAAKASAEISAKIDLLQPKKYKTSDLPLTQDQQTAIQSLLVAFKKKGGFDNYRKKIWADFDNSEFKAKFTNALQELAEKEIEREPAHLSRDRGKAATLIEGAVDRSDIYKNTEHDLESFMTQHLETMLSSIREIRRKEVGEEIALKEEIAGNKTEEDYDRWRNERRAAREKIHQAELAEQARIDAEKEKIRQEDARKRREIERKREEEQRERDEKRRAEQRALDEQREKERQERYERRRREDSRERYRSYNLPRGYDRYEGSSMSASRYRDHDRRTRSRTGTPKAATPPPPPPPPVDDKTLEEAALQLLLKEGEELAAKAKQKPEFDFEEAEAIESGRIRLVTKDDEAALARAQDDLLDTKLKAGTSQERGLSDFGIAKTIGILFVVTETSGGTERAGTAVVGPRLTMIGIVTEMTGVIGRADAAAPGPRLAIGSVTGSIAVIDANEIVTGIGIGTVIESETETAIEKETGNGIGTEIVTVIELIEIVKGTATEIETETVIGIVRASWTAGMIDIRVVIWTVVGKESRHGNGLQNGTEIVAGIETKIVTDHETEMIAQGQDPAAGAPHLVQAQIVLAHDIAGIDQVLALLLADDLSHGEDHALQINQWTLIDMSQEPRGDRYIPGVTTVDRESEADKSGNRDRDRNKDAIKSHDQDDARDHDKSRDHDRDRIRDADKDRTRDGDRERDRTRARDEIENEIATVNATETETETETVNVTVTVTVTGIETMIGTETEIGREIGTGTGTVTGTGTETGNETVIETEIEVATEETVTEEIEMIDAPAIAEVIADSHGFVL